MRGVAGEVTVFRRILVAIDLTESDMAERGVETAEKIAKAFDSDLRLINAQTLVPIAMIDYVRENFDADVRSGLDKEIRAVATRIDRPSDRVSTIVAFGPVYQQVLAEAENWGADLIVVGSHRPGMERFLIGSNAGAIVQHAKCSVLIVR